MGVNTKCWGPHAWRIIHTLGRLMKNKGVYDPRLISDLRFVLPCIYCRKSFTGFWNDTLQHVKDPFMVTYYAHTLVNHKLDSQEKTDKRLRAQPSRRKAYASVKMSKSFYSHLSMFLHYVIRDWKGDRSKQIKAWLLRLGKFLARVDGKRGQRWSSMTSRAIKNRGMATAKKREATIGMLHCLTHKPNLVRVNDKCNAAIARNCP